jgi:hypothetical protein
MSRFALVAPGLFLALSYACAAEPERCEPGDGLSYICGTVNAEDLVLVPGTPWVLSSAMTPGAGIYLIDATSRNWSALYSGGPEQVRHDAASYPACATAPALANFVTHGLHMRAVGEGHSRLYVVGHGGREAIEVFDVETGPDRPALTWIGCVQMPDGLGANSVTSLRDGSLLATVLLHPGHTFNEVMAGKITGAVYRWSPGDPGFVVIKGSELPGNNGIEVSADGREIFVASTGLSTISAFANTNPTRLLRSTGPLDFRPDNVHMTADGQLITAGPSNDEGQCGPLDAEHFSLEKFAACPRGSVAATFDPATLKETRRWSSPSNREFSNATMALQVGDGVWIGSFSGDRIGIVANPR